LDGLDLDNRNRKLKEEAKKLGEDLDEDMEDQDKGQNSEM